MTFRNDINGLRAIAVCIVVLFHFNVAGFHGGYVGVDIFFVISGYLMTGIIFSKLDQNSFYIIDFYLDRVKRIIPALAVLCFCLLAFGWFILLPEQYALLGEHAVASISFLSNITYWGEAGYFDTASHSKWLLHTWSLSVEWQFYILYPVIILLLKSIFTNKHLKYSLIFIAVLSYSLSVAYTQQYPSASFFLLPTRAWEMLAGGILYLHPIELSKLQRKIGELLGLTIILLSVFLFSSADLWPGYLAIFPVLGTILVLMANNQHSILTNNKPTQWIGKASYSIYLWHWPIIVFLTHIYSEDRYSYIVLGILLSVLLGALSYHLVERNTHHLKYPLGVITWPQFIHNRAFIAGAISVLLVTVPGSYIKLADGMTSRVSANIYKIASESKNRNPRSRECNVYPNDELSSPQCVYGNESNVTAVVLGDSHSNSVITAIEQSLNKTSGGALFLGADGCFSLMNTTNWYFHDCNKFNSWVRDEIANNRSLHALPIIIVNRTSSLLKGSGTLNKAAPTVDGVTRGTKGYIASFANEYKEVICQLTKTNPVYVLQPIAEMPFSIPEYEAKKAFLVLPLDKIELSISDYHKRHKEALMLMREVRDLCGVTLLDPLPYLCNKTACPSTKNGRSLYYDEDHLSEYGNTFLVPLFEKIWPDNQ